MVDEPVGRYNGTRVNRAENEYDNVTVELKRTAEHGWRIKITVADQHLGPRGMALAREGVVQPERFSNKDELRKAVADVALGLATGLAEQKGSRLDPDSCRRTALELFDQVLTEARQRGMA